MGRFVFVALLLMIGLMANAQNISSPDTLPGIIEDSIYKRVEFMPEFSGGREERIKYLAKAPYPPFSREGDIERTPYIQFVVEADGQVSNVTIARYCDHPYLEKAAMEHIQAMPKWKPGYHKGKPVRVQYVVPVKFRLQ